MDLVVTQVMRRNLETVPTTMPLPELEGRFIQTGASGFPVLDGDQLVGVISRSDIVRQLVTEEQLAAHTSDFYRDATGFHEIPLHNSQQMFERIGQRMQTLTVADCMHRQLFTVGPNQTLRDVAVIMVEHDIHRVLVTRDGHLLGLVSTTDFARLYAEGKIRPA